MSTYAAMPNGDGQRQVAAPKSHNRPLAMKRFILKPFMRAVVGKSVQFDSNDPYEMEIRLAELNANKRRLLTFRSKAKGKEKVKSHEQYLKEAKERRKAYE